MQIAVFVGMLRTRVDRNRAPHPCVNLWVSGGSGVRCFVVRVACDRGLGANVMALRSSARQYKKLELGVSGFALLHMNHVLDGPLSEMISPLLTLDDATKLRTDAKH